MSRRKRGSVAMEDEDSPKKPRHNEQSDEVDFEAEYDSDGYGDDADRDYLDSLPEVQRERILYERSEKRREMIEQKDAQRRLRADTLAEPPAASTRSSAKNRGGSTKAAKQGDALADLQARRHNLTTVKMSESFVGDGVEIDDYDDDDAASKRKARAARRRGAAQDDVDELDEDVDDRSLKAESESSPDAEAALRRFAIPGSRKPVSLEDIKGIQLRRDRLEKLYEEPYFADVIRGMFARVTVGHDAKRNVARYRIGEVIKCEEMKSRYPFPPGQTSRHTKLGLMLRRGNADRVFRMDAVSNHSITTEEFEEYLAEQRRHNQPLLSSEEAKERRRVAEHRKETFEFTPEIVAKMIEDKQGRGKQMNVTLQRTKLETEIARAKAALAAAEREYAKYAAGMKQGDDDTDDDTDASQSLKDAVTDAELRIESLENRLSDLRETEVKIAGQSRVRGTVSIAEVNAKNAKKDIDDMRQMFVTQERERYQTEEQLRKEGKSRVIAPDPFKRRATRPSMNLDEEEKEEKEADEQMTFDDEDEGNLFTKKENQSINLANLIKDRSSSPNLFINPLANQSSGLLSFPHPPSVSERLAQILSAAHSVNLPIELPVDPAEKEKAEFEARAKQHIGKVSDNFLMFTQPPSEADILTVTEYWTRKETA